MSIARCALGIVFCLLAATAVAAAQKAPSSFGFQVAVNLSPRAAQVLHARSEQIVVAANYFGYPNSAHRKQGGELGEINLAPWQQTRLPASGGIAEVRGVGFLTERLGWLKDRMPWILVNVFSARLSSQDNLLTCDVFQGPLGKAQQKPISIHCSLIEEIKNPLFSR